MGFVSDQSPVFRHDGGLSNSMIDIYDLMEKSGTVNSLHEPW